MQERSLKLSIVIPVYNGVNTLQECVESIIGAQLLWNYEILLVNDGSTDGSEALCFRLQEQWKDRIRYIYKKNGGSLSARLRGIREARGEYLLYVDCDDVLLAEELNAALKSITQPNAELYLLDYLLEHPRTREMRRQKVLEGYSENQVFEAEGRKPLMDAYMSGALNTMVCSLIRHDVARKALVLENEKKMIVGEDRLQKMFAMIHSQRIEYIPRAVYRYISRPNSQSAPLYTEHIPEPQVLLGDFVNCWHYEVINAEALLQTDTEKVMADLYRIRRVCKLLTDVLQDPKHTDETKKTLFSAACHDTMLAGVIARVRRDGCKDTYAYTVAGILERRSFWQFVLYIKLVDLIRIIKYGRK